MLTPLPDESTVETRLATIPTEGAPVEGAVRIYWDSHQIPFVEADHDRDAAFALGLVHAHLRLGQMELFRKVSQGRVSEMGGPLATDIDYGLRILNFERTAEAIEADLPPATREWLEGFVAGINFYVDNTETLPLEFRVLNLQREPWTVRDILTMGRLAATDITWLVWFSLLPLRDRDDWPDLWARLIGNGSVPILENGDGAEIASFNDLFGYTSRSGSNSVAVAPSLTANGSAIMANDPHLGIFVPNIWLVAGVKSPSYHVVGLMGAGLPVFAIGRNPSIAWGGTNLRAASSDLVDISSLPPDAITDRQEEVGVRWWFDDTVTIREAPAGPVVSDAPQFAGLTEGPLALSWVGHTPSDEVTTFLKVSQATTFEQFVGAFETFAVPAQNMLYADVDGNIGKIMAARLPRRGAEPPEDVIIAIEEHAQAWDQSISTADLPASYNPEAGYLTSANNRPAGSPVPVGYFFSPDDRVDRMAEMIETSPGVDVDLLAALQQDVYMASAVDLRDAIARQVDTLDAATALAPDQAVAWQAITAWDGHYNLDSRGAVAFEAFRAAFLAKFYQEIVGGEDWEAFAGMDRTQEITLDDIAGADQAVLRAAMGEGFAAASGAYASGDTWGDRHRLIIQHPLANIPIVGSRYRFLDLPAGGSSESLMKTAHGPAGERHQVRYGSQARHISDMADPDANYFVLLGGQDGWFNSTTFLDQVDLWQTGEYVQVPLTVATVRDQAVATTVLSP
ncbi:MAG: penicillin acylase family protein [Pseudomonadota bacterium]